MPYFSLTPGRAAPGREDDQHKVGPMVGVSAGKRHGVRFKGIYPTGIMAEFKASGMDSARGRWGVVRIA